MLAFEKYIGHALPAEYRAFLLQHNGGTPEPDAFLIDTGFGDQEDRVECFFPLRPLELGEVEVEEYEQLRVWPLHCAWDDLQSDMQDLYEGVEFTEPLLPIGTDGCSNYFCVVLSGKRTGAVVFLDHETAENYPLGESFNKFLATLRLGEENEDEDE